MSYHDRFCPLSDLEELECVVCDAIGKARGEEIQRFNDLWRTNLRLVELRWFKEGYVSCSRGDNPPEETWPGT